MEMELHQMSKPVLLGQHGIEKELRMKIRDLEDELFKAKRAQRKRKMDGDRHASDKPEEEALKR